MIVSALQGCITYGKNFNEAMMIAKQAFEFYIKELLSRGEKISDDRETSEYSQNINKSNL